jgi:hypothetical protein
VADNVPTRYIAARVLLTFLDLFGWVVLIAGLLLFFSSAGQMFVEDRYGERSFNPGSLLTLGPATGFTLGGLLALANVQLTRAAIDSADINREMLRLMRSQG